MSDFKDNSWTAISDQTIIPSAVLDDIMIDDFYCKLEKKLNTLRSGRDEGSRIATESRRIYCSINIFRSPLWNVQGKNDGSLLEKLE